MVHCRMSIATVYICIQPSRSWGPFPQRQNQKPGCVRVNGVEHILHNNQLLEDSTVPDLCLREQAAQNMRRYMHLHRTVTDP